MIACAKSDYENSLVRDYAFKQNHKMFSYIRSLKNNFGFPDGMHLDGKESSSWHGTACLFNEYFNSVYTTPSNCNMFSPDSSIGPSESLSDISFSPEDVYNLLSKLDISKATGIDGIPNYVLKCCAPSIYQHVYHVFSECIARSYIPVEWKIHKLIPIHKKGDRSSVKNYRPISLLCCISKVLESIAFNSIYDFVEPALSRYQFGFSKNRSTVQQLLIFNNSLMSTLANKSQFDAVYFDIKKAFDTVD